jgi:antitoxin ParD1/3/4
MNVSIGERWKKCVANAVALGSYNSSNTVVRERLRLVEEREAKLSAVQETLKQSILAGGDNSDDDVAAFIYVRIDDVTSTEDIS